MTSSSSKPESSGAASRQQEKCPLDENHCVNLADILMSFSAPISEEHAWALCYQCAKCFRNALKTDPSRCKNVTEVSDVLIHRDGHVHSNTIFKGGGKEDYDDDEALDPPDAVTEQSVVAGLGLVIYKSLDYGMDDDEERDLSPELSRLIKNMIGQGGDERHHHQENDENDEGIEWDSGYIEYEEANHSSSLAIVIQDCTVHLGCGGAQEADSHYKAVCRALVAEARELSTFLQNVGTGQLRQKTTEHLDNLNFTDWARLWVQVVRELRRGVQLKKVCYTRKPIEFELTPYEILMDDIRSRRYKLNKVMVDGNIPHKVKKDAHAVILEFIRSRPPLRKASERKLNPPRSTVSSPRELLLESIKQGQVHLKPSPVHRTTPRVTSEMTRASSRHTPPPSVMLVTGGKAVVGEVVPPPEPPQAAEDAWDYQHSRLGQEASKCGLGSNGDETTPGRRLIKVDSSLMNEDSDDDEEPDEEPAGDSNPWQRTAYDLATQCPTRRASARRHTVVVCEGRGSLSVPQSRPESRQTDSPSESLSCTLPEMTWSRTSLQDDLLKSKQWQEECLSLTLEEIVHIRSVLTKAELESLPVEGRVKEDAERRKVCFLCMKTRFGIFGPWGQICKLCKRTVCAKCYSKMRIPTEHFSHVPVVALSPSMLSPTEPDDSLSRSLALKLLPDGVGSAPTSPKLTRSAPPSQMSTSLISEGPISLPPSSPSYTPSDKWRVARARALGRQKAEKLKGLQMTVCHDCKAMVLQIIKSSRTTRNNAIRNLTLDLSPVY